MLEGGWRVPCSQINQKQKLKITLLKREFSAPPFARTSWKAKGTHPVQDGSPPFQDRSRKMGSPLRQSEGAVATDCGSRQLENDHSEP